MSNVTLKLDNSPPLLSTSLSLSPSCLLFLYTPLSSVNSRSLAPLEGDVYYLVSRPLLDFYFSSCGVRSMPLRWKNALLMMMMMIIVFGIMVKKKKDKKIDKNKRNVLLNVVQIALEMLCFLKRAQTRVTVSSTPPERQTGIKQPASQSKC